MPGTSLQLGEVKYSYAYESTGKFLTEGKFEDYGITFGVGDVIGAYLVSFYVLLVHQVDFFFQRPSTTRMWLLRTR